QRDRLLQVAAPGHRRVTVAARQRGERGGDRLHVPLDEVERRADLQDRRGVGDVLRGGAPVAPFAETVGTEADDLLHHPEDRLADALGLLLEARKLAVLDPAAAHDLLRRLLGNDPEARLRARQRRLDLEVVAGPRLVGEDLAHLRAAEDVAEDFRIERGRGHRCLTHSTMLGLRRFWSQSIRLTCRTSISQRSATAAKRWPHQPERYRVPSTRNSLIRKFERTMRAFPRRAENTSTFEIMRTVRDFGACDQ